MEPMLQFKDFIKEEFLVEHGGAGASADTKGKLRELEVGKHLNGGKHMESYRAEGKLPEQIHHEHATKADGENYQKSDSFKKRDTVAKKGAQHILAHLAKHGYGKPTRTVWASQPGDHESETKVKDPNNSADLIVTTDKSHKRSLTEAKAKTRDENKIAVSMKTGSSHVNYSNPGVNSLSKMAGRDLTEHTKEHEETVKKNLSAGAGAAHAKFKALRDSSKASDKKKADTIKKSSEAMNAKVAHHLRQGLADKSHEELHAAITNEVAPKTHLKHLVSRQITDKKTGEEKSHHTYDLHGHVHEYLNHFHSLHVDRESSSSSVTVHGIHKKTGKKMAVARVSVSAGGRPANASPRGTVTLPSEDHKDVHYTSEGSEHMEHH
jgi:hypothetical protein